MIRQTVAVLSAGLLVVSSCGDGESNVAPAATDTATPADQAGRFNENDLVYLTRSEDGATVTLDIHWPAEPRNAPLVIGGERFLVDDGVIVVDFDDDDHLGVFGPEELLDDRAAVRAITEQYACAIRLARVRAAALGNEDPIVVLDGFSLAGGIFAHLALLGDTFEARWDEFADSGGPPRQYECAAPEGSTHVDALIGVAGTYDIFVPIVDGKYGLAYQQENDPEMQEFLASAVGVNPDLEIRLIHGTNDDIRVEVAEEFAAELIDAGYDAQLTTWPGGHRSPPRDIYMAAVMDVLGR